jgi:cell wall-associated NlpC family hydrolase
VSEIAVHVARPLRRIVAGVAAATFLAASLVVGTGTADAAKKPVIPSQSEVDAAKAAAQAKAEQIGATQAELAAADAQLQKLNDTAEVKVEAYNGAVAKLQVAQQAAQAAQAALRQAQSVRAGAEQQMARIAARAYMGSGDLGKLSALVTSSDPQAFLAKAGTLSALGRQQQAVITEKVTAERKQVAAQQAAQQAVAAQQKASDAAAAAKDAALQAMNDQASQVQQITASKQQLQAQLAVLQGKAKNLADARKRGLAELAAEKAREEAAARAAAARLRAQQLAAQRLAAQQAALNTGSEDAAGGSSGGNGGGVTPGTGHSISTTAQRQGAIAYAQAQIGVWYRWAGAGEVGPTVTDKGTQNVVGFDCSGLTMRAYGSVGISLGHYTGLQWDEGMYVSRDQLQPGDLVFFATNLNDPATIHHVGIYVGNGQMIDAPQTGEQIGIHNAFRPDYIGAVRP